MRAAEALAQVSDELTDLIFYNDIARDMIVGIINNLLAMLERGQDNALLRYSLGSEYFKAGEWEQAVLHATMATEQDPAYSAAWKLLGKALLKSDRRTRPLRYSERGIAVAEDKGDVQAAKEMRVFLKRARAANRQTASG